MTGNVSMWYNKVTVFFLYIEHLFYKTGRAVVVALTVAPIVAALAAAGLLRNPHG